MAKRKLPKKSSEDLSTENELLKLKMMAELGGKFMGSDNIPADVENVFLKQIMNFHKQKENSKLIPIYRFIGEPEYNHVNDLSNKEVEKELNRMFKLLAKNNIALNVLAETPQREIYRFITEELFKHEIEDARIKGWVNQFIYEEFHPNAEYDVKNSVQSALQTIFNKGTNFYEDFYSEEMKDSIGLSIDVEEFREKIEKMWNGYFDMKLGKYSFSDLEIDREAGTALATCNLQYKTKTAKEAKFKTESTVVEMALERSKYMESWWEVKQVVCDIL